MSNDPFEYVTPPLKIVRDMVAIPRAQHEALKALVSSPVIRKVAKINSEVAAIFAALRAAGIQMDHPND